MSDSQIFQILSIVYIAVGVGMLINPDFYRRMFEDFIEHVSVMYLGGVMALGIGYLILAFHNTWTEDLSVIITIIGYLALIKGIAILVQPKLIVGLAKVMTEKPGLLRIEGIAVVIIGVGFSFLGFCPKSPI